MALVMVVDKMKYKWFGIITILSLLFLVATTIVAIVGPNERIVTIDYAYKCENNSHTWNPDSCGGVQLSVRFFILFDIFKFSLFHLFIFNYFNI